MEAKGIRTDKGELNRWIKKTNAMLREAKKKIAALLDWLGDVKAELSEELSKPQAPLLVNLLGSYYTKRNHSIVRIPTKPKQPISRNMQKP